jgi:hypothetical protein
VHIVGLPDPAAARTFAFAEPNYQAGAYRDVLLRRWPGLIDTPRRSPEAHAEASVPVEKPADCLVTISSHALLVTIFSQTEHVTIFSHERNFA